MSKLARIAAEKISGHTFDTGAAVDALERIVASTYEEYERLTGELLKALEPIKECTHDEETWYCDSCKYEWEKRVRATADALRKEK